MIATAHQQPTADAPRPEQPRIPMALRPDRPATALSPKATARIDALRSAIGTCYGCGVTYIDDGAGDNFCSDRCASFIAQGGVPRSLQGRCIPQAIARWADGTPYWDDAHNRSRPRAEVGKRGVFRDCDRCGGRFGSLGLKLCPSCFRRRGHKPDFELPGIYRGRESAAGEARRPPKRGKATPVARPQNQPKSTNNINGLQRLKVTRTRGKTIPCAVCEKPIKQTGRRKTLCSPACKQRAYRGRDRSPEKTETLNV